MSSLTKFELNKLIVSMRHNVKRAKVHTVNKLSRQSKMLKNKKAPDKLKQKNENKAERLVNEILVMKKIPLDEVAAFSLINVKPVSEVLSDVESSPRLKALARLSIHKSIFPVVKQFRAKYPTWETEFPKVLVALKKREKLKDAKKKSKEKKSEENEKASESDDEANSSDDDNEANSSDDDDGANSSDDDDAEDSFQSDKEVSLNGNPSESENESESRFDESLKMEESIVRTTGNRFSISSDDFNVSDSSTNRNKSKIKSSVDKVNFKSEPSDILNEKGVKQIENKTAGKPNLTNKLTKKTDKQQKLEYDEKTNKINKKQERNDESETHESFKSVDEPDNGAKRKFQQILVKNAKQKVDPFFLSSDNKPYKTIEQAVQNNRQDSDSDEETTNYNSFDSKFKRNKQGFQKNSNTNNNNKKFNSNNSFNNKRKFDNDERPFKNDKFNNKRMVSVVEKKEEKLHPSWAAKKKQSNFANFEGKKVVFD